MISKDMVQLPSFAMMKEKLRRPHLYTLYTRLLGHQQLSEADMLQLSLRRRQAFASYLYEISGVHDTTTPLSQFVREGTERAWELVPPFTPSAVVRSKTADCFYWRSQTWWGLPPASPTVNHASEKAPKCRRSVTSFMTDVEFLSVDAPQLKAVRTCANIVCSSLLTPRQLADLRSRLGCRLQIFYSFRANVPCISTCPNGGLHVLSDGVHIEATDRDNCLVNDGEVGELRVTAFDVRDAPIVRAPLGRMGAIDRTPCKCGLPFPKIYPQATD